jgi:hypothetical protein
MFAKFRLRRATCSLPGRRRSYRPLLEILEQRLPPAFDLTIGSAPTAHVLHDAAGHFTANAAGATIAVGDIATDLLAGKSVAITNGPGGSEGGNITWQAHNDLDVDRIGGILSLTIAVDSTAPAAGGNVILDSQIFDSDPVTPDGLNVNISATRDLTVKSNIAAGPGSVSLAADVKANGSGDNGVGSLTIGAGASVTGTTVGLRGADVHIDTSAVPGTVGAQRVATPSPTMSVPVALAFDGRGDLFVACQGTNSVSEFAPGSTTPTAHITGLDVPVALACDAQGNLFVCNEVANTVSEFAPGQSHPTATLTGLDVPFDLAFDSHGNLFVANLEANTISEFAPGHTTPTATLSGVASPFRLAVDPQDDLFVANGTNTIRKFAPGSVTPTATLTGTGSLGALSCDQQGNVFAASFAANAVTEFAQGSSTPTNTLTGLNQPNTIAIDAHGNLFAGNVGADTVSEFAPGSTTPSATLTGVAPRALATDAHGNLFVVDDLSSKVSEFAPGSTTATATLQELGSPTALAFDSHGNLFVSSFATGTVSEITPGTIGPSAILTDASHPVAEAFDARGDLFVSNFVANTVSEFAPGGVTPSATLTGLNPPAALTFDAHGNLFVANETSSGTVSAFAPGSTTPTATLTGLTDPDALAFDAYGNLFVANQIGGTISKFAPGARSPSATLTGPELALDLAFDAQGNLFVANGLADVVSEYAPGSTSPSATLTGVDQPERLAFDLQGNLYVSNFTGNSVSEFAPGNTLPSAIYDGFGDATDLACDAQGDVFVVCLKTESVVELPRQPTAVTSTLTIRSSLPGRPISAGGGDNDVAGINLTDAELAQILTTAGGSITIGDASQTGAIAFKTAELNGAVTVVQSATGAGKIVLDEQAAGTAISATGNVALAAGHGGVPIVNGTPDALAVATSGAALQFGSGGPVGSLAYPLATDAAQLTSATVAGSLYFADIGSLATVGAVKATGSMVLKLGGDFTSHFGDLQAPAGVSMVFNGSGTQNLDTGGQALIGLLHTGPGTLRLQNASLFVRGNLTNAAGDFDANGQAVNVNGLTTINGGTFEAGSAVHTFRGGLVVNGGFSGGSGNVTAGGVTIGAAAVFSAPASGLVDSGDWNDAGGLFDSNAGTVTLNGKNQHVRGSNVFNNLVKLTSAADTLTFDAGATQTVLGALTLQGNAATLALRSSVPGAAWNLDPEGSVAVAGLDVADSADLGVPIGASSLRDSGGNSGWAFTPANLTWTGDASTDWFTAGNWDLGYVPSAADSVTIPGGGNEPLLRASVAVNSLIIADGASLTLDGNALRATAFNNQGTLILRGSETLNLPAPGVHPTGTWQYVGDGSGQPITLRDFGAVDYANLVIDDESLFAGTFQAAAPLTVTGTFTVQSGTYDAHGQTTTVGGVTTVGHAFLTAGTYRAGSGVQTLTGGLVVTGSAFGASSGAFVGSSGVVNVGHLELDGGDLTAPTGKLNDSGDWTILSGAFNPNGGTVAFTGAAQAVTSAGRAFNRVTHVSKGTLTLQDNLATRSDFTNTSGTLNAANRRLTIGGSWTWTSGTFVSTASTVTLTSSGASTLKSGGAAFFNLAYAGTGSVALLDALTVTGALDIAAGTFNANGQKVSVAGLASMHGGTYNAGAATQAFNGSLSVVSGSFLGGAGVVTAHGINVGAGATLTAPSSTLNDSGDWLLAAIGNFNANHGTVALTGANQHVSGSVNFFNLTKTVTAADTLTFDGSSVQTIGGKLTLSGAVGRVLALRSSVPGVQWNLRVLGPISAAFLDIEDSHNLGTAFKGNSSRDSGNNTGWIFA